MYFLNRFSTGPLLKLEAESIVAKFTVTFATIRPVQQIKWFRCRCIAN